MARLDAVMVQQGMVPSRQRAKTLIQNGQISVNGKVCTKPAFAVSETDQIDMEGSDIPYQPEVYIYVEDFGNIESSNARGREILDEENRISGDTLFASE